MWKRLYDYLKNRMLYMFALVIICLVWVVVFLGIEYFLIRRNLNSMVFVILALILSFIGMALTFRSYEDFIYKKDYDPELLIYYIEQQFSILIKIENLTTQQYPVGALEAYHDLKKALLSAEIKLKDKNILFYYRNLYGLLSPDHFGPEHE